MPSIFQSVNYGTEAEGKNNSWW